MSEKISDHCNFIDQKAISELLDGRTFFIPSYQRGYRWTKTQIYDLCNDLLEYALKPNKDPKAFYSLQPLIVREAKRVIEGEEKVVYEVIDGQQRLTSIYILYRLLMVEAGITSADKLKDKKDVTLYHIFYETRPKDYGFIESLGFEPIFKSKIKNIDIAHIANSYNYIGQWLRNTPETDLECARSTWARFSDEKFTLDDAATRLFNLLNNAKDTKKEDGNAQFIWYEIDADKDAIQEFLSENKGKIGLTNTEKIRALFMQRRSKDTAGNLIQLSIAKDWELIENTLHRNDFWSFISNETQKEDGRIELIFQYLYDRDDDFDKKYDGKDKLFRYYYQLFNNRTADSSIVDKEWRKVMSAFRMLQNWYQNPWVYNLVGLLTKNGLSTKEIYDIYSNPNVVTTQDYIDALNKEICKRIILPIEIKNDGNKELDMPVGERYINLSYGDPKVRSLLQFLNVNVLCQQIEGLLKEVDKPEEQKKPSDMGRSNRDQECAIYRFPFDALDAFGWDVEHIDSATTNQLDKRKDQEEWIKEAEKALGEKLLKNKLYSEKRTALESASEQDSSAYISDMLNIIKKLIGEDDIEQRKNWIGNLTLLDKGTNRSYKNWIFARKRKFIRERINNGVFIPVCTQNIFNKTYHGCGQDALRWDFNDKKSYHSYILSEIDEFTKKYKPIAPEKK